MKADQDRLFIVPRADSRFTRETLRRGGPREVMGVRGRSQGTARIAHEAARASERAEMPKAVIDAIGWKPRRMS